MGMNKVDAIDGFLKKRTFFVWDHFGWFATGYNGWSSVLEGSATVAVTDNVGGIVTLSAIDNTNNRQVYLKRTNQEFKFVANQSIELECLLQFSEAATNAANVMFGVMSSVGSNSILDDGGGPKASFSGAVIYKVDGGSVWKTCSSLGTTQTINTSDTTAGGSSYQRLSILIEPVSSTVAEVTYKVDGVALKTSGGRPGQSPIKDTVTYTGAAIMQVFVGLKNGTTTAETLNVDYIYGAQNVLQFT